MSKLYIILLVQLEGSSLCDLIQVLGNKKHIQFLVITLYFPNELSIHWQTVMIRAWIIIHETSMHVISMYSVSFSIFNCVHEPTYILSVWNNIYSEVKTFTVYQQIKLLPSLSSLTMVALASCKRLSSP